MFEDDYALEKQLADMDAAGVDWAVIKLPCAMGSAMVPGAKRGGG